MSTVPLTPESIAVILQYIVPPSQLSPLPPHLLSSSLRQRHHFLNISPDQPASYLAWPSDSDDHHTAVRLLEDYQCPIDDRLYSSFPIRYTSDLESTYAHVSIAMEHPPDIRLVFQWNTPDGWKYHNLTLMPFPSNSFELLQDALQSPAEAGDQVDTELTYWDAYTGSDDSQFVPPIEVSDSDSQHGADDSYWSQYATIHGSGDSTLPTPQHNDPKRVLMPFPGLHPTTVFNPLEPPSPRALARRLADLHHSPQSPPQLGDSNSEVASDSLIPSSLQHPLLPTSIVSSLTETVTTSSNRSPIDASYAHQHGVPRAEPHHESHEALKDAIRGLHRLWKLTRQNRSVTQNEEQQEFLEIVRQVVSEPSLS